jgi:hypothetical protein
MKPRKRRLTQQDLRALGTVPGLSAVRYPAGGDRAEVRQLAPESFERRKDFARRLADSTPASEGGQSSS